MTRRVTNNEHRTQASKPEQEQNKKDKYIPLYFVAFFLVIFVVLGTFTYLALSTHRGVVTEQAYQKGLAYNETIAAAEAQKKRGWQGDIRWAEGAVHFTLNDADGKPIEGAEVQAYVIRPIEKGHQLSLMLDDAGNGTYSKSIDLPLKGQWGVTIHAIWKQQSFQISKRIAVQ